MTSPSFRLAHVPGVTPDKWVRVWDERSPDLPLVLVQAAAADAAGMVRDRAVDAALLRLGGDRTGLHAIPLYTETTVVVAPKDHLVTASDELSAADLADEVLLRPLDDVIEWTDAPGRVSDDRPESTADAMKLVAAGLGLLVVPQSLFRLHFRKDLTSRPIPDAPQSRVALSWLEDETTDPIERFIGIVRGRTPNSTRGRQPEPAAAPRRAKPPQPKPPQRGKPRKRR
ncbi:substrate-binding domain-containing protein [Actinokineospora fastidiosa]|uniref:LysR family transcriptional regulator n=1 Tax=Actinokineospora fastidiosa TaxID=1816 RepID=A0A918GLQ7_9PSEU|nr:substrate-binding domain-containing protein [Actinokineospora fastidiosa]GGS46557.1 LysR family transcriptional regulator [Actinokineospora fastidiosa]